MDFFNNVSLWKCMMGKINCRLHSKWKTNMWFIFVSTYEQEKNVLLCYCNWVNVDDYVCEQRRTWRIKNSQVDGDTLLMLCHSRWTAFHTECAIVQLLATKLTLSRIIPLIILDSVSIWLIKLGSLAVSGFRKHNEIFSGKTKPQRSHQREHEQCFQIKAHKKNGETSRHRF